DVFDDGVHCAGYDVGEFAHDDSEIALTCCPSPACAQFSRRACIADSIFGLIRPSAWCARVSHAWLRRGFCLRDLRVKHGRCSSLSREVLQPRAFQFLFLLHFQFLFLSREIPERVATLRGAFANPQVEADIYWRAVCRLSDVFSSS